MDSTDKRRLIRLAFDHDHWVARIEYTDRHGEQTVRIVSPTRWTRKGFQALDLCREGYRQFSLERVFSVQLIHACDVQIPEPLLSPVEDQDPCPQLTSR